MSMWDMTPTSGTGGYNTAGQYAPYGSDQYGQALLSPPGGGTSATVSNPFSLSSQPSSNSGNQNQVMSNSGSISPTFGSGSTGANTTGTFDFNATSPTGSTGTAGPVGSTNLYGAGGIGGANVQNGVGTTTVGNFNANAQPYQLGGEPQSDVNTQALMNIMARGNPFQNTAQNASMVAGQQAYGAGGQAISQGNNMYSGANAVMNTAFDPQQTLYNKLQQQNTDQTNANEAQRGITMSPYGAGVANESNKNFNIDWQNQQLQRQESGLQSAGTGNTTGANLQSTGVNQLNAAGQLPYATGQQAFENSQQSIQDYLNYLNHGTAASAGVTIPVQQLSTIQQAMPQYNAAGWQIQ